MVEESEKELSLAEQAEELEERFALQELNVLEELKKAIESMLIEKVRSVLVRLVMLENNLYTSHQNVLSHITILSQALPDQAKNLKAIEIQIEQKVSDVSKIVSARGGSLYSLAEAKDFNGMMSAVASAENSLSQWIGLIKKIKEEFEVTKKEYRKILAAPQEKIIDLLRGTGIYAKKSQKERQELWNRWARVTTQRIIKNADLTGAQLQGFNMGTFLFKGKITLKKADLRGADLVGADLVGADLWRANLRGANLREANLREANLRGAYLGGADLREADLWRADLGGADLGGADLGGVQHLVAEQLKTAMNVRSAKNIPTEIRKELGL